LDLLEHNGIEDPRTIRPGDVLHLPISHEEPEVYDISIEVLPEKRRMHVVKPGGTRKWLFGRARSASDLIASGPRVREDGNVDIVAIAHVPLPDEARTMAFFIDPVCFGNYGAAGRLRYTIGFDPGDLADGYAEPAKAPQRELPAVMAATVEKIAAGLDALNNPPETPTISPLPQLRQIVDVRRAVNTSAVKASLHPLYEDRHVERFVFLEGMDVLELDGCGKPVRVATGDLVDAYLGVYADVDEYGNPVEHIVPLDHDYTGYFYLIPRSKLMPEGELYCPGPTDAEADVMARYRLTASQRYGWSAIAYVLSRYRRLQRYVAKKYIRKES
jgi:hypothetical protein